MKDFLAIARERILIFDGGLGTALQRLGVPAGICNELLVQTDLEIVYQAHADFLRAGAQVIETDTFGGARHILAEHGLDQKCFDLNRQAAKLARRAADDYSSRDAPRFVAGSIGPGSKLPSLNQIKFTELIKSYTPQIEGLLEGAVDCLIVETSQDLLQMKAVLAAIEEVLERSKRRVPVMAQVTIDAHGRTLTGSDVPAVLAALEPFPVSAIGLNCGLGPEGIAAEVRYLAAHSSKLLSVMPNAGLPRLEGDRAVYDLSPDDFAQQMKRFARGPGLNMAGGCCGTGPEHIAALASALSGIPARKPRATVPRVSSLFRAQEINVRPKPFICGERTNASGSKKFRELLLNHDYEAMVRVALDQENEGAHLVDLSVAAAGRDEISDMAEICRRLNTRLHAPVMVDATDPKAVETALQHLGGRCVVNSVNLENRAKAERMVDLCRKYGAALVLMTLDEKGMAMTAKRKLEVAEKLYDLAVGRGGLAPESVFFDFLTFSLGSGEKSLCDAAAETLKAIKRAKKRFPRSFTLLGVSNVSHGLDPEARRALNTVFLHRAIQHGLDAAILHAGKILPLSDLDPKTIRLCDDLIFNRQRGKARPLETFLDSFGKKKPAAQIEGVTRKRKASNEEKIRHAVLSGDRSDLKETLQALLKKQPALAVIENNLLPAMNEVGKRFESGRMQLPFVLRSAEVMRDAFEILKPKLPTGSATKRGTLLLATVRGDIHDIGKNLVDMIVSSNGFHVINLGVRQTPEDILAAARKQKPDAIGLSGLLVESARAMKEYVEVFAEAGLKIPVICGGAALDREYVEKELSKSYPAKVFYAKDAMSALRIMREIPAASGTQIKTQTPEPKRTKRSGPVVCPPTATKILRVSLERILPLLDRKTALLKRWRMITEQSPRSERTKAERMFDQMLRTYNRRRLWRPVIVRALFPARISGRELLVLHPESGSELTRFSFSDRFLRKLKARHAGKEFTIALQVVTIGGKVAEECGRLAKAGKIRDQFLLHGLAAELTEALADFGHQELSGSMPHEKISRYSPGYPVWPDLSEQEKVFSLLRPERIGITLTETFQMVPEYSTSAVIVPS